MVIRPTLRRNGFGNWQGLRAFGVSKPTQVAVWEQLMDAKSLLLTANTETVYAVSHLALKDDGRRRSAGSSLAYGHRRQPD